MFRRLVLVCHNAILLLVLQACTSVAWQQPTQLSRMSPTLSTRYSCLPKGGKLPLQASTTETNILEFSDFLPYPNPEYSAVQVVETCMNGLQQMDMEHGLEICFNFSSDQCRAALGGSLAQFIEYANNPVFGSMVGCLDWSQASVGPIIPRTATRGAMQTVLIDVETNEQDKADERRFLWTLQQERRPPRQGCWLVQSCIFVKNSFALTV